MHGDGYHICLRSERVGTGVDATIFGVVRQYTGKDSTTRSLQWKVDLKNKAGSLHTGGPTESKTYWHRPKDWKKVQPLESRLNSRQVWLKVR